MPKRHPLFLLILPLFLFLAHANVAPAAMLEARGLIKARYRTVLSSEIVARVVELPYRPGSTFDTGDPLVRLDCALLQQEKEKTAAGLEAAKAKLAVHRKLEKLQSIGALEIAQDEALLAQRRAEWQIAALAVNRCTIKAPYRGKVVRLLASEHQSVRSQQELLEILSVTPLEIEVMAPSSWLAWLRKGYRFQVVVDETGTAFPARVMAVGAAVEPVSKMVLLRGRLEKTAPSLVPGMGAIAYFKRRGAPAKPETEERPGWHDSVKTTESPGRDLDSGAGKRLLAPGKSASAVRPVLGITLADGIYLRSAPGTGGTIIGKSREKGEPVTVLGKTDGWFRVNYQGREGYMFGRFIRPKSDAGPEPETE